MKKIDAIMLLAACVPLANRLAAQGVKIELTEADRAALAGFNRVRLYDEGFGWRSQVYTIWSVLAGVILQPLVLWPPYLHRPKCGSNTQPANK